MTAEKIRLLFGDKEVDVAVGLQFVEPDTNSRSDLVKLSKEYKSDYGVRVKNADGNIRYGFSRHTLKGEVSAAAWLAGSVKDVMLVEQLPDGRYWFAHVREHLVFPGHDVVGSLEKISQYVHDVETDQVVSTQGVRKCARGLSHGELFQGWEETDFADLVGEESPSRSQRIHKILSPVPVPVAVAMLALVGFVSWQLMPEPKQEVPLAPAMSLDEARAQAEAKLPPEPPPPPRSEVLMTKALDFFVLDINRSMPSTVGEDFRASVSAFWNGVGGWVFESATIDGDAILIQLKNAGGTLEDARLAMPEGYHLSSFTENGDSITVLRNRESGEDLTAASARERLENTNHVATRFASQMQEWGVDWTVAPSLNSGASSDESIGDRIAEATLSAFLELQEDELSPVTVYRFEIRGGWWLMQRLDKLFEEYPTATIRNIEFAPEGFLEVNLKAMEGRLPPGVVNANPAANRSKESVRIRGVLYEIS